MNDRVHSGIVRVPDTGPVQVSAHPDESAGEELAALWRFTVSGMGGLEPGIHGLAVGLLFLHGSERHSASGARGEELCPVAVSSQLQARQTTRW